MRSYLTPREESELAERMATDYVDHQASIRVLMFEEGLSYGAVHRLLTQVAGLDMRGRGGTPDQTAARDQFDDLDPEVREQSVVDLADAFVQGARITELAEQRELYPYTVLRLLLLAGVERPRRLDRAPRGSGKRRR
ncbi:hypothetical protein HUO13_02450 [Saccharopolyspora erythraea]|uniref:helix-turn-helix domain-containing protein n=1 Tax=Saccharopolyspora erythraea TaxID=1836 RepID=UPI001BA8C325|nr:helix-turn-helix domain-containing protein [Saccharopolyspora erythraea]QUG99812.1 hypothetical protein HUO13_02450 [Saccharopolyspora erythraea]